MLAMKVALLSTMPFRGSLLAGFVIVTVDGLHWNGEPPCQLICCANAIRALKPGLPMRRSRPYRRACPVYGIGNDADTSD